MRFAVLRVPFFLEPGYSRSEGFSETNLERLRRKWGGKKAFDNQKRRHGLKERGHEVGIEHFVAERTASSTMASHKVVQYVTRTLGSTAAERLYNRLNSLHFEHGHRLNDAAMLAREAAAVGADAAAVTALLSSDRGEAEIEAAQNVLAQLGISSIPTFVIDGRYVVNGAARSAEFIELFRELEQAPHDDFNGKFKFADALGCDAELARQATEMDTL